MNKDWTRGYFVHSYRRCLPLQTRSLGWAGYLGVSRELLDVLSQIYWHKSPYKQKARYYSLSECIRIKFGQSTICKHGHPAGTSVISVLFEELYCGGLLENIFSSIHKRTIYVTQNNIEQLYCILVTVKVIGIFPLDLRMQMIFTDFQKYTWLRPILKHSGITPM